MVVETPRATVFWALLIVSALARYYPNYWTENDERVVEVHNKASSDHKITGRYSLVTPEIFNH